MQKEDLINEVLGLINVETEGDYWDFKQQWYDNNADLLHDIICMANNLVNKDAYIIIGVTDSRSPNGVQICGISTQHRKSQQNVIDFLKDKPFAGSFRPTVYVQTLLINGKEIDVIIIKNTSRTPFYLTSQYQSVRSGNIYTRIGDTNTPKDSIADIDIVEYLWRKRFGIDLSVNKKLMNLLKQPHEWEGSLGDGEKKHHTYFPEYQVHITDNDEINESNHRNCIIENIASYFCDTDFCVSLLDITYHTTVLYSDRVIYLDGSRHLIPFPDSETIYLHNHNDLDNSISYQYFDYSTIKGALFLCLSNSGENTWYASSWDYIPGEAFLQFINATERKSFNEYLIEKLSNTIEEYNNALVMKGYKRSSNNDEYFISGWSKANNIKASYLYDQFTGRTTRKLIDYIPSPR